MLEEDETFFFGFLEHKTRLQGRQNNLVSYSRVRSTSTTKGCTAEDLLVCSLLREMKMKNCYLEKGKKKTAFVSEHHAHHVVDPFKAQQMKDVV